MVMTGAARSSVADDVVLAYDHAAVEDFARAVDEEVRRLTSVIDDARARAARARALLQLQQTMLATMADLCREASRRMAQPTTGHG
jgi:hypothetical protein